MSSDESVSTQISTISSQIGNEQNLKSPKSEQWGINLIGNFLLSVYHRRLITLQNNWTINKSDLRKEFKNFLTADLCEKLKELNGTDNIGTLLERCGFIQNTPHGSTFYQIKTLALFEFRNQKLQEQDNWRINNDLNKKAENIYGVKNLLGYQGTTTQQRLKNYCPTNMSCFICQEDFSTMSSYEEHIIKHNNESDFEFLKTMSKFDNPIFILSYRLCKNSHYFYFEIETKTKNLIIEKIIIVQSRSLHYIHNARVPYSMPDTGCEQFFIDCHLFTIHLKQPIILICHSKDSKDTLIIEQHHFVPYRLPKIKTFKPKFQLAEYFPPEEIQEALNDSFYIEKLMNASNEFRDYVRNEKILQPHTIGPSLNMLLQVEDLDTLKEYLNLTQRNVNLRSSGGEYSFKLRPQQRSFAENILSFCDEVILLTSSSDVPIKPEDFIRLMLKNKDDIKHIQNAFIGQIENIHSGRITFKCYKKIDLNTTYTVICRPSRLSLRYQYRSLEMLARNMPFLMNFLFPAQLIPRPLSTLSLTLYNQSINGNPEQLQAVRNIAEGPRNDAAYIIFGPPGTGKTTTIVEAILQVLKREGTKILVTASTNSACDEVALRLCQKLDELDMSRGIVRIYSRSSERRVDNIDDKLLEHSNMYDGYFPDIEVLHKYRIVVCTLTVVAKLSTGKFGRQVNNNALYTHLFIDEVAASMEAEALVAITAILTPKSSLIIAGDHKQLGPVILSKRAKELGLGLSLMERLLDRECYSVNTDTGNYDRTIQTRLRLNFRSHPDIVNLYSSMYYNHALEAKANLDDVSLVKHWHLAPNKEYPIIFHCVHSPSHSDNSGSLHNKEELSVVMDYVKDLMYFGINGNPVKETDIGIISPYKKQYNLIQKELNLRKWFKIETGSVEIFQGKEKQIIIVSFVRSNTNSLGFLENPKRLNVTISRAKSLLIMIGNPQTLSLNDDFAYIIKECQRHKSIVGSTSGDVKNQHHKSLARSIKNLNDNRRERLNSKTCNTTKDQDLQQQTKSVDLSNIISTLNESMQKFNIKDNGNQPQQPDKSVHLSKISASNESVQKLKVKHIDNQSKRRKRNRGFKSRKGQKLLDKIDISNNDDNHVSIAEIMFGDNKPSTSKAVVKKNQSKNKFRF